MAEKFIKSVYDDMSSWGKKRLGHFFSNWCAFPKIPVYAHTKVYNWHPNNDYILWSAVHEIFQAMKV